MWALALVWGCAKSPEAVQTAAGDAVVEASGREPMEVLAEAADDLDASARARALALLVRHADEAGGGDWAPRALYDPNPWVPQLAVEALHQRLPEDASLELLRATALRGELDAYTRGAAALRAAWGGADDVLEPMRDAWRTADDWDQPPLALAGAVLGDDEALAVLAESLERGDLPLELRFFGDLGASGLQEVVPALTACAKRVEPELEMAIAAALLELGASEGESMMREALNGSDLERRLEALDFLVSVDTPEADTLLTRAARGAGVDATYAQLALVARGLETTDVALQASGSVDRELRRLAVWALGQAPPAKNERAARPGREALASALDDTEYAVVLEAVQAIANTGRAEDVRLVEPLMAGDVVVLRVEAAAALLLLGSEG